MVVVSTYSHLLSLLRRFNSKRCEWFDDTFVLLVRLVIYDCVGDIYFYIGIIYDKKNEYDNNFRIHINLHNDMALLGYDNMKLAKSDHFH